MAEPTQVSEPKVVSSIATGGKKETPSLKILPKATPAIVEKPTAQETVQESAAGNSDFTLQQLQQKWKEFMLLRQAAGKLNDSDKIIFNKDIALDVDYKVILKITSSLEQDILARFELDLVGFLRKELGNSAIVISTQLIEMVQTNKLYTNRDKLEHMISQNSKLKKLQETLGLDTDF